MQQIPLYITCTVDVVAVEGRGEEGRETGPADTPYRPSITFVYVTLLLL